MAKPLIYLSKSLSVDEIIIIYVDFHVKTNCIHKCSKNWSKFKKVNRQGR